MSNDAKKAVHILLMPDEFNKLELICKELSINKTDFLRACVRKLPRDKEKLTTWFESLDW